MAELRVYAGPMSSGKSTLALQTAFNLNNTGVAVLAVTMNDRGGDVISSRIGISCPATIIDDTSNLFRLAQDSSADVVVCDEAQFYSDDQVEQLADIVDYLDVDVYAYGLLSDFRGHLFDGTARLLELADRRYELQVETRCWCGNKATHNARTINGVMTLQGETVVVGDTDGGEVAYELLCRRHFMTQETKVKS